MFALHLTLSDSMTSRCCCTREVDLPHVHACAMRVAPPDEYIRSSGKNIPQAAVVAAVAAVCLAAAVFIDLLHALPLHGTSITAYSTATTARAVVLSFCAAAALMFALHKRCCYGPVVDCCVI